MKVKFKMKIKVNIKNLKKNSHKLKSLNVKLNARWIEIALLDFDVRKRRTTDNSDVNTILNTDALQRGRVSI